MGKRREKHPFEDNPFIEGFLNWMGSDEGQQALDALDRVWPMLERADVDAKRRRIIWPDGQRLSITQSVKRIHTAHADLPLDLIEQKVISWLEMQFVPEGYSPEQLDEFDELTGKWIDDHESRARKASRTPDS